VGAVAANFPLDHFHKLDPCNFGKGKGRFIACGALVTAFASDLMIGILDMD
jgi:hypothetical protein